MLLFQAEFLYIEIELFMSEGSRPCTIFCFNVHTKLNILTETFPFGQLIQHNSKFIVVCARSRLKMLENK